MIGSASSASNSSAVVPHDGDRLVTIRYETLQSAVDAMGRAHTSAKSAQRSAYDNTQTFSN